MIHNNLSSLMEARNLKVKDLAQETGLSQNGLYNLFYHCPAGIKFQTLNLLCNYFKCSVGDLLEYIPDERGDN